MSKEIAWLEQFTGLPLAEVKDGEKSDPARADKLQKDRAAAVAEEEAYARKRQQQALMLAQVRVELLPIKARAQVTLATKMTSGPLKGKSFLKVEGEQIDEIDPDSLRTLMGGKKKLSISDVLPDVGDQVGKLVNDFDKLGQRLALAKVEGKAENLFTTDEVTKEYWAPLRLERVYPDGLVLDAFSETQRMLDETNQLYLDMCEQKRIAGELTPEISIISEVLGAGKDLVGIGAEALGGFTGGSEQIKLAKDILENVGSALGAADDIYKKIKESDYTSAASSAIDITGKITGFVVGQFAGKETGELVEKGFSVGSSAVLMGKALAQYRSGDGTLQDALDVMGELLGKTLALAGSQTGGATADGLKMAAKAAPAALRAAGLASGPLKEAVRAGNFPEVVKTLGEIAKQVVVALPGLKGSKDTIDDAIDLAAAGVAMSYTVVVNARKGDLQAAFNTVIDGVSDNLAMLLKMAEVPPGTIKTVVGAYKGGVSAAKAVQILAKDRGDVIGAMAELGGGLKEALAGTEDRTLITIGDGIEAAVQKLVSAKKIAALYAEKKPEEALTLLVSELGKGVGEISVALMPKDADDEEEDADEDEDEDEDDVDVDDKEAVELAQKRKLDAQKRKEASKSLAALVADLKDGKGQADPAKVTAAAKALDDARKATESEQADEEARLILEEAQLDLQSLTDAERTGAEASNIDNLIATLLRDRMILKIATQIATGGADFLTQFVPALGAVSAGIKLAANLLAVAQRAQQLDAWIKAQKDLSAAQSALSSSAANFVKNQGQQLAHYSMQAFFAATQLAGKIAELAGPASPAGTIVAAAAGASAKAEEMLNERADKIQIEQAWKVTQKSLRNPKNRQLGLEARKQNPSLAKFSIAWGAVVLKDPLARDAMRSCGLNEASLKDDNTDVNKVVKYLEIFYEDDKTLYRDSNDPVPEWIPADAEVTLKWWSQLRHAANTKAKLQLKNAGLLEGLLAQLGTVEAEADASATAVDAAKTTFLAVKTGVELAIKTMGVDSPAIEPPSIEPIEIAADAHHAVVIRQYGLLTQIATAYEACAVDAPPPKTEGAKPDPNIKELQAVLLQLKKRALDASKVSEAEAQGVATSMLELKMTVERLRGTAAAKVVVLKKATLPA